MRILLVEDDRTLARSVRRALIDEGFSVDLASDGQEGFHLAMHEPYDAIILDLMIPYVSGLDVLRGLRDQGRDVPVIVISAKGEVEDRTRGLDLGADDYLAKPFRFSELLSRLRALIRRSRGTARPILRIADLEMDLLKHRVTRGGKRIDLSPKEFSLLEFFLSQRDRVLTRSLIAEHVWDRNSHAFSNVIDVYIRALRLKIDREHSVKLIHTVRGVGYLLSTDAPMGRDSIRQD